MKRAGQATRREFFETAAGAAMALSAVSLLESRASATMSEPRKAAAHPNIVYILCDDLGYGDVHAFNPKRGKIKTPHIDGLTLEGLSFTNAHSGSAVCTPSRYGILTGRYAWRTHLQSGVLGGLGEPLISPSRMTVATLLKTHGYTTACFGKWHLGLHLGANRYVDPLVDGPTNHGFDTFFGISASPDMPPFVYIENDRFTEQPTTEKTWIRPGPAGKDFEAAHVLPDLTRKATDYITEHGASAKNGTPFFLYLALTAPHTPVLPSPEWQGKSGLGPYGDFVMQVDATVGDVLKAIKDAGIADNTLVIFTSDNGCAPYIKPEELEAKGHYPSAQFRGYKADIWDGGHRIPFVVRWPGKVKAGSSSDVLLCQTDFMATCAELIGAPLPENAGEDSFSMMPLLTGKPKEYRRESAIHHSIDGYFALRRGKWKLELCAGSGGWAAPREYTARQQKLPPVQLYDMALDIGEKTNVADQHPDVVRDLTTLLEDIVHRGRSTPGPVQRNDVKINLHKEPKPPAPAAATPKDD